MDKSTKEQIFKVGHRVKVIRHNDARNGQSGTVESFGDGWYKVKLDSGQTIVENMFGLKRE